MKTILVNGEQGKTELGDTVAPHGEHAAACPSASVQPTARFLLPAIKDDPPGTVILGSIRRRAYLYLCQTEERMVIERANAREYGIEPLDFIFDLDGERFVLSYAELKAALHGTRK